MADDVATSAATGQRPPTARTRVRRNPARGRYDADVVATILDAGLVAHVGVVDCGQPIVVPIVVPMAYARDGDRLILHGSSASRTIRLLAAGAGACATVTLLDADGVRSANAGELAQTLTVGLSLADAVAKQRVGPPKDDAGDLDSAVWSGVVPVHTTLGEPIRDLPDS